MPPASARDVLVKVEAVSVNNLDLRLRAGTAYLKPVLPHVLGWDPAGTVVEVGTESSDLAIGDRVVFKGRIACGSCAQCIDGAPARCSNAKQLGLDRWGGYAEFIAVPAVNLRHLPANLSFIEASVIFRHFPQAFNLLDEVAKLEAGEWVLVMGAAGALGSCLVQVAKLRGARVIAAAGTDDRAGSCLLNGADEAVNYRANDLAAEVAQITEGRGVDVVTDNIGDPALWPGAVRSLAFDGRLVTVGAHGGGCVELDVDALYRKRLRIIGTAGSRPADVEKTVDAAAQGLIRAVVGAVVPLGDAATAHHMLETRSVVGKVMLQPSAI